MDDMTILKEIIQTMPSSQINDSIILELNNTLELPKDAFPFDIYTTIETKIISNMSEWGPKRDSLYIVIPITILYVLIFFTGVIGNISTCIVIAKNKNLHTATNYYLFSLAISDLLLLVSGLPSEMYYIWNKFPYMFGEVFCIIQSFAAETSANATVLTITAFTVERYVAICHPFLSHTMSNLSRAVKFVIAIWAIAMILAIPQAISFGLVYETTTSGFILTNHYVCTVKKEIIPHAFEISTIVFFIAPMSLITILYILIGLQLRKSNVTNSRRNINESSVRLKHKMFKVPASAYDVEVQMDERSYKNIINGVNTEGGLGKNIRALQEKKRGCSEEDGRKNYSNRSQTRATKHVVKMLVAVVVAFFICWAPFHTQRLLVMYTNDPNQPLGSTMIKLLTVLTYVSGVLYYLSTTINPLLYHIMSNKFRAAFKNTFSRCFIQGRTVSSQGRFYSTLSGRSSQVTSQSGNSNVSFSSRQNSVRYLQDSIDTSHLRRPLVVSFRRHLQKTHNPHENTISELDIEIQKVLNGLENDIDHKANKNKLKRSRAIRKRFVLNVSNQNKDIEKLETTKNEREEKNIINVDIHFGDEYGKDFKNLNKDTYLNRYSKEENSSLSRIVKSQTFGNTNCLCNYIKEHNTSNSAENNIYKSSYKCQKLKKSQTFSSKINYYLSNTKTNVDKNTNVTFLNQSKNIESEEEITS